MKTMRTLGAALTCLCTALFQQAHTVAAERTPDIASLARPAGGAMQMLFHGGTGPFQLQKRASMDPSAPWVDIPEAKVTEVNTGVYMATFPMGTEDANFYRVMSLGETIVELEGWSIRLAVSAPTNGTYFATGEAPVVTVTLLDTFAQGLSRADFSSLNLYMYGPQDPQKVVTAVKLLNASTDRNARPHHYIDLKTNPDVQVYNNVYTYSLKPVTDEAPGTYRIALWAVRGSDAIQQVMRFVDVQIGTATVEQPVIAKAQCAACHEGQVSGKMYLHHIDVGFSPVGNWSLDYDPDLSCASCHNNDGYAAFVDANAPGGRVPDQLVRRVHGVHMGEELKNPFNTNPTNGNFSMYTHVLFPANIKNCTSCHIDNRWKTKPSRLACGSCHDNVYFGQAPVPEGMEAHPVAVADDSGCSVCHPPDVGNATFVSVADAHEIPPPAVNRVTISMTPPANGSFYAAGDKPKVTLQFMDDSTNPVDHTLVTDGNYSTASLFVYGPRARAVPVLTSAAKNVNSKLRASVSNNKDGPWAINGKVFRIAINGSAPQDITITGTNDLVTPAEVVASLNPVITNLNGGARASATATRVTIRTLTQGDNARIEIYNGDVTTAMVWKRPPNTVMEPDVTIAAANTQGNDLRAQSDPLNYTDPMVTRNLGNITYQLDDVAGLTPGTYSVYSYYLPTAGKVPGVTNKTGYGFMTFQVGSTNVEKKIATNCKDCHSEEIFHLASGPIHAEPFDTDYCTACHDYGKVAIGEMFKNQGGTSLAGWSGFGAMPIVRRVHGVHKGAYLDSPEEIYANATKDTFGHIIFPQDLRNCTKCHAESNTWKQNPSRIACLACHDSDSAKAHGSLMTYMPDPADPYGPQSIESCEVCHGEDGDFAPDKVHKISNPYVPPYPREPSE